MQKPQRNTGEITRRAKGGVKITPLLSLCKPLRSLRFLYYLLLAFCISSCEKEPENSRPATTENGVYILNEGNFLFGNARVGFYNKEDGSVTEDLFQPANNRPLGDVLQSMYVYNGKAYLVVNNSQKIEVVDAETFVSIKTIANIGSPRYFLPVSSNKAYITDYENTNAISILDLNSNTVTGHIPCPGWTEGLALSNGKTFITNMRSNKVYVVNVSTDQMEDSISISYASNSIVEDKNGNLWVLCSGDELKGFFGGLHRISPTTLQVEQSFQFSNISNTPWRLNINSAGDTLYFLNNDVYRMAITDNILPPNAFIPKSNRNFYGIGIDPETNVIYVADAIDFVQRGVIYRYLPDGPLVDSFHAGIVPGDFWFQ